MSKVRTALLWLSFSNALSIASSYIDSANWMRINMAWMGDRTLKQLCLPGTHNSGMGKLFGGTSFSKPCNSVNQNRNIRRQLELGIRFFDVRPVLKGGVYRAGHYSNVLGGSWQGGYGHTIESIVNNLNAFTREHNELIIVYLSHTHNTERDFRPFDQKEWNKLLDILNKTESLFQASEDVYFPIKTLDTFLKNGTDAAVVYILGDQNQTNALGSRVGKGFFYYYSLKVYDRYSNTDKTDFLLMDQMTKMRKYSTRRYFLMSWTLTQNAFDATMCPALGKSNKDLANLANKKLKAVLSRVTTVVYPNVISVDYLENSEVTEIAMAINLKWLNEKFLF